MSVDFFQAQCQSRTTEKLFGICDKQNGTPAFIDTTDQSQWIAKVLNDSSICITHTAIDNCISILNSDGTMAKRCDAMLIYTDNIVFVELKNQRADWITDAVEQIEVTINHFIANHNLNLYKHKRAFTANKKHPQFNYGNHERSQRFFRQYRVRLNIQSTIKILTCPDIDLS